MSGLEIFATLVVVACIITIPVAIYGAIYVLAMLDIVWTLVEEGSAKLIYRNRQFHKAIMSYAGWRFKSEVLDHIPSTNDPNDDAWEIEPIPGFQVSPNAQSGVIAKLFSGIRYVGIPPSFAVHWYQFKWTTVNPANNTFTERDEPVGWVFVKKAVYGLNLTDVEDAGGFPLNIKVVLVIQVVNPAKAIARAHHWLDDTLNRVGAELRGEIGKLYYAELIKGKAFAQFVGEYQNDIDARQEVLDELFNCNDELLRKVFGVDVTEITIGAIDPAGADFREATVAAEKARRLGQAAVEKARKDAEATIIEANAQAEAVRIVNDATIGSPDKESALELQRLRTLEKTGSNLFIGTGQMGINLLVGDKKPDQNQQGGNAT